MIDAEYDIMAENADNEVIEKSKRELGQMEAVLGNDNTINSLVCDILDHYENNRENLLTGKAMIVAYSRPIAMKIYKRTDNERCPFVLWNGSKRLIKREEFVEFIKKQYSI